MSAGDARIDLGERRRIVRDDKPVAACWLRRAHGLSAVLRRRDAFADRTRRSSRSHLSDLAAQALAKPKRISREPIKSTATVPASNP